MTLDIPTLVQGWRSAPHISARSVLVTVLGDALLPVSKSAWLSQLFQLAVPYNFSSRLVRTSLFRLADEAGLPARDTVDKANTYSHPLPSGSSPMLLTGYTTTIARLWTANGLLCFLMAPGYPYESATGLPATSAGMDSSLSNGAFWRLHVRCRDRPPDSCRSISTNAVGSCGGRVLRHR